MIENTGKDEYGRGRGGKAGDQTGHESEVRTWYNRPWACILRYPVEEVGQKIADISRAMANNNNVGYDMNERLTYYNELKNCNWKPQNIKKPCETDCSASTSANIIAAGNQLNIYKLKNLSPALTTFNMRDTLEAAGFKVLTDKIYLTSDKYLLPGDILLYDEGHVAVNLDRGSCVPKKTVEKKDNKTVVTVKVGTTPKSNKLQPAQQFSKALAGTYKVSTMISPLALRYGASTKFDKICDIPKGKKVQCYGYFSLDKKTKWLYIKYKDYTGFACGTYLKK